jgi:hypothetical protein
MYKTSLVLLRLTASLVFGASVVALLSTPRALADPSCGVISYPSGAGGTVVVAQGDSTCSEAMSLIDRFLNDQTLTHEGNTMAAQFDGWVCASPTAVMAQQAGYSTICNRGSADVVEVRP